MEALETNRVTKLACGGYHTLVLTSEDELFAFGANSYGELGLGDTKESSRPRRAELVQNKQPKLDESDDVEFRN